MIETRKDRNLIFSVLFFIAIILAFFIIKTRWIDGEGNSWKGIVEMDGRGYYAHLPAVFIYHDLTYDFIEKCEANLNGIGGARKFWLANGQPGNKYFVGEAVLLLPFFLVSYVICSITGPDLSGYNVVFFASVALAAWIYLLLSLIYIRKTLLLFNVRERWIGIMLLLIVFGTNIFHYVVYEPSMSHIYSFFIVSIFIYHIKKFLLVKKGSSIVIASIALGLITILRPVNVMIVLSVPFLAGSLGQLKIFFRDLFINRKALILAVICYPAVVFIQLFIYYKSFGSFIHYPYGGEAFYFLDPHFFDALISYQKGFFIYTPMMFVAFLFIIPYFRQSVFASFSFILSFIIFTWVISSWSTWFYGGSFSMRPFIEYYPYLILPMAIGLNNMKQTISIATMSLLFITLTGFSLLQTYQYEHHIINYGTMDKERYWKVFLKTDPRLRVVAYPPLVEKMSYDSIVLKKSFLNDFEMPGDSNNNFCNTEHFSGSHSFKVDKQSSFSPGYNAKGIELSKDSIIYAEINIMAMETDNKNDAALVISLESPSGQIFKYDSYPVGMLLSDINKWEQMHYSIKFPKLGDEDVFRVYVWNTSESQLYVDDLKIKLFSGKYH